MSIRLHLMFLLALVASTFAFGQESEQLKIQADKAYEEGNLEQAIDVYEKLSRTVRSASVEYNLGNAYFRLNKIPEAILHYERALRSSPTDENVLHNLELARNLTIDKVESEANSGIIEWWTGKLLNLGERIWGVLGILFAFLFAIAIGLFRWQKHSSYRQLFIPLAAIFLVLSGALTYFSFAAQSALNSRDAAIVMEPKVDVLSAPQDGSTELFVLHEGTKVKVIREDAGWLNISLPNGLVGWVKLENAEVI